MFENHKKFKRDWLYQKGILEAMLHSSRTEDNLKLPTIKEFILSELVNGTIDYVGGEAGEFNYQKHQDRHMDSSYETRMWDYYNEKTKDMKDRLNPKISKAINEMVKPEWHRPGGPDRPYCSTRLYDLFMGHWGSGICNVIMDSIFTLPYETVLKIENKVMPSLTETEKRDVRGIGKSMARFVDEDLRFINKTYMW